jgi:hypothetical protein
VTEPELLDLYEPRHPRLTALLVAAAAAFTLLLPLLAGQILFGGQNSDMLGAGYSFRLFGAQEFRATGQIPQWNPYLFGGLPYIAAMHGDIFYPTAWLRWIMPTDLAITWGMAVHFILAAYFMWCFGRALGLSWTGAMVAGVAYQLSGIVASQVSPGHDGKLFVSALAPLAFLALLKAIRHSRTAWFGWLAVIVGLCVLSPHYQMTYFLLIALGIWTLYLVFLDPERTSALPPAVLLGWAALAVVVGIGISALQVLPFLEYIPYSPRAAGGPNTGWEYVNLFAMPPEETMTAILPEFNGILADYWGRNPFKLHTEYLGASVVLLALLAWGRDDASRGERRVLRVLGGIAVLFLLLAFAGHTPFYRPWFEFMPMMKKLRAMGMVFYLVALPVSVMAGMGADRLLRGQLAPRRLWLAAGALALIAVLGVVGVLQAVAEGTASADRMAVVQANATPLRLGSLRLLVAVLGLTGVAWLVLTRRARAAMAAGGLIAVVVADLWAIDRRFFDFSPRASVLFGQDEVTQRLAGVSQPFRVLDPTGVYGQATLMAYRISSAIGYHGNELRTYDELGGKDHGWSSLGSPSLWDLLAVRFIILDRAENIPGFRQLVGPVTTARGATAILYERDTIPDYARVVIAGAKLPEQQIPATVADPRFPGHAVVVFPESATVTVAPLKQPLPQSAVRTTVTQWSPGHMRITLDGRDSATGFLLVSENWYPDWKARVDGAPAVVHRADHALLSVQVPSGAKEVELDFDSAAYARGKTVSLLALIASVTMVGVPVMLERRGNRG